LHSWNIDLQSGEAISPDKGCAQRREVKIENGDVWLRV
jgi:nitrite reductase (NADH) small subunit